MTGEVIWVPNATEITLEASGGTVASAAFAKADDNPIVATDYDGFVLFDFRAQIDFNSAPTAGRLVNLYCQLLNFDGTNDAPDPSASYPSILVGSFMVTNSAAVQYLPCPDVALPLGGMFAEAFMWIENAAGIQIDAWKLYAKAKTFGPSA